MTLIRNVVLMTGQTIHFMQKYGKLLKVIPVKLSYLEHWNHCNVCFRDKEEKFSHNYYPSHLELISFSQSVRFACHIYVTVDFREFPLPCLVVIS